VADLPAGIAGAQRFLGGAIGELGAISRSLAILPEIARTLHEIRGDVRSLDAEVTRMREAVERIEAEVGDVRRTVRPLSRIRDRRRRLSGGPEA